MKNELDLAFGVMAQNKKVETILPESELKQAQSSEEESDEESESSCCNCAPILVADDNEFNLFTLQEVLRTFRLNADGASNGQEAY